MKSVENNIIKFQEWIVRFDGQISHSEKFLDRDTYQEHLKNVKNDK